MASTRDRFVATASRLFREKGFGATSVGEIAEVGELPIGSLYYYFPGGKEELGGAAIGHGADGFARVLAAGLAAGNTPGDALASCARGLADRLESSRWREGCPVATVALESVHRSEPLRQAADQAFTSWIELVAARLIDLGVASDDAVEVASVTISVLEGAELMARVSRSREPLDAAALRLPTMVEGLVAVGRVKR